MLCDAGEIGVAAGRDRLTRGRDPRCMRAVPLTKYRNACSENGTGRHCRFGRRSPGR
jgi:hypothetical protein